MTIKADRVSESVVIFDSEYRTLLTPEEALELASQITLQADHILQATAKVDHVEKPIVKEKEE